mgnify:CR=1 FL=1
MKKIKIPVEVSARHAHISQEDFYKLFKKNNLTPLKDLGQNQFAAKETIDLICGKRSLKNIRIVGPFREATQIEISITDSFSLGLGPCLSLGLPEESLENTFGGEIVGAKGKLKLKYGIFNDYRHLHISSKTAKKLNLKQGQKVKVEIKGKRGLIFDNIYITIGEKYNTSLHLDTDEGNACGITKSGEGYLIIN